ncbi:MAG: transaldolase [Akkermansiaceae bacterium]|nr:transaldolase [Akkermansiaceae bacterium]
MNHQIKIFADGASISGMLEMMGNPLVSGFTTNPTLMKKAGIRDYEAFAKEVLANITNLPISFEVFSDTLEEMQRQALLISSWAENVYVKIPSTNTQGISTTPTIANLAKEGVKLNITAMTTPAQVAALVPALADGPPAIASVFAGRIADSGRDPLPLMKECLQLLSETPNVELLWASPREIFNLVQAGQIGCHIITMTNELIAKIPLIGKDLDEYALETVRMFAKDAESAGYEL